MVHIPFYSIFKGNIDARNCVNYVCWRSLLTDAKLLIKSHRILLPCERKNEFVILYERKLHFLFSDTCTTFNLFSFIFQIYLDPQTFSFF